MIVEAIAPSAAVGWLAWRRAPRSTWASAPSPAVRLRSIQEAELDGVAAEEGHRREQVAPPGGLARERLGEAGQVGVEEVDQRPGADLGHPPAPVRVGAQRPPVDGLHVADLGVVDDRAHEPGHERGVEVHDVRVQPDDHVAPHDGEALPHRLALSPAGPEPGEHLVVLHHARPGRRGDRGGVVLAAAVHDDDLVEQAPRPRPGAPRTAVTIGATVSATFSAGRQTEIESP